MDSKLAFARLALVGTSLLASCVGDSGPQATDRSAGEQAPPSIWGGVEIVLLCLETLTPAAAQVEELSLTREEPSSADATARLRLESAPSGATGADEVRALALDHLRAQPGVLSCRPGDERAAERRETEGETIVLVLTLELPAVADGDRHALAPPGSPETILRSLAVHSDVRVGAVDIARDGEGLRVRSARPTVGQDLDTIHAYVQAIEATPGAGQVRGLHLRRAQDEPASTRWTWELEVPLRRTGG